MAKAKRTVGAHGVRRASYRTEVALAAIAALIVAAAVACWIVADSRDSETLGNGGSGLFLLGNVLVMSVVIVRMRADSSVWLFPVGPWVRRIFLVVMTTMLLVLAIGALSAVTTGRA